MVAFVGADDPRTLLCGLRVYVGQLLFLISSLIIHLDFQHFLEFSFFYQAFLSLFYQLLSLFLFNQSDQQANNEFSNGCLTWLMNIRNTQLLPAWMHPLFLAGTLRASPLPVALVGADDTRTLLCGPRVYVGQLLLYFSSLIIHLDFQQHFLESTFFHQAFLSFLSTNPSN